MEGIRAAEARGTDKSRKPRIDAALVSTLHAQGLGAPAVARRPGIGRASVYRPLQPDRVILMICQYIK